MKKSKIIKLYNLTASLLLMIFVSSLFSSCDSWFDIKPESELVEEDFWKKKSDVESSIAACYRALEEPAVMERFIVWGEMRSDNVVAGTNVSNDISYILNANIDADNGYTQWGSFYTVINNCNTVLEHAAQVQTIDPNFTIGELRSYIAEATALRALCYFYLVRTFKDVPYSTQAYTDDTRPFQLPQTSGDAIIDSCLTDLEAISENYVKAEYSTMVDTKGRITQKALWTLMADMYLWKNDYDKCIDYCEKVQKTTTNPLQLELSSDYNRNVYGLGNSKESIFELQFDSYTPNYVVNEMYGTTGGRNSVNYLTAFNFRDINLFNKSSDQRYLDAFYAGTSSSAILPIKKYVAYRTETTSNTVSANDYVTNENSQNWIIYRLADVMLMEAEALTERNQGGDLDKALALVNKVYERANPSLGSNPLTAAAYGTQAAMRDLVFDERQRELLFEGKRYFDILRRIRRQNNLNSMVAKYLIPKYANLDQATVTAKLSSLNALYMPINTGELKVNALLKQNPFYATPSDITKQ
jgi:hypothetical protein